MTDDRFIIDTMTWSYSRLTSFHQCPYGFKLKYVDCNEGINNFFGEYGSFIHKILEMYAKGELEVFELSEYYEEHWAENVTFPAPPNKFVDIGQSYYDKGLEYLNNIDLILDDYEILGVEKEVSFDIGGYNFIGYIDLLLKDKKSGEIIVLDHKSHSLKLKKNGEVSKSDMKTFESFKKQLYLYSIQVEKEYGHVDYLEWNLFKDMNHKRIEFKKEEQEEAIQWVVDTIKEIEETTEFNPQPDMFFCNFLCDQRNNACEFKN